jgi:hypothetical protein
MIDLNRRSIGAALGISGLKSLDILSTLLAVKVSGGDWSVESNFLVTALVDPVYYMIGSTLVTVGLVYYCFDRANWVVEYVYIVSFLAVLNNLVNLNGITVPFYSAKVFYIGIGVLALVYIARFKPFFLPVPKRNDALLQLLDNKKIN